MQTASPLVRYIPLADAAEIIGVTCGRVMELIRAQAQVALGRRSPIHCPSSV